MEAYCNRIFLCIVISLTQVDVSLAGCEPDDHPWSGVNNTCPSTSPFLKINGSGRECVSTCGPVYVLRDTFCIDVEKCERMIVDDGHCLEMCPEGYVYFPDSFDEFLSLPEVYGDWEGIQIYCHFKGEERRIRCQKKIVVVIAIFIIIGIASLWSLILYVYLHPRPCCIVRLSQSRERKQGLKKAMDGGGCGNGVVAAADVADDDEPLLNGNLSVQNTDEDILDV